jgi:hypothetical protein
MPSESLLDRFRPSKLWRTLPPDRRLEAAQAFWADDQSADQKLEAVLAIANHMNFRARSIAGLTLDRRTRYLASLPAVPEAVAARLLVAYHLNRERPMMAEFLDALGIPNENGLITGEVKRPDATRLSAAAASLRAKYPVEDVRLYFSALISQDPDTWGSLVEHCGV